MTFASDTLTVGRTGIYMVATTASYADGGNTNFETAVFVNDVKNEMSACHASTTGSLNNNTAGTSIISITEGDEIQLRIVNHSNTNNVVIEHCSLTMVSLA